MPRSPEVGPKRDWVELDGYRFPLVEGSGVQFRPVTQFAPASQIGPANRPPPDPRWLVATFADLSRGAGIQDQEEIDGLNSFRSGTFDTRSKRGFGLPPAVETLPTALPLAGKGYTSNKLTGGGKTWCQVLRKTNGEAVLYVVAPGPTNDYYFTYELRNNNVIGTLGSIKGLAVYADLFFGVSNVGILYALPGLGQVTLTTIAVAGDYSGLARHDNKLFTYNNTDRKVYGSNNPIDPATWAAVSVNTWPNAAGRVTQIIEHRDLRGDPALVLVSEAGAFGMDEDAEPAEWQQFIFANEWGYRPATYSASQQIFPRATVWRKDSNAYFVFPGSSGQYGLHVMQHNGTARDVGPLQSGGFDVEGRFESILKVEGNTHFLYAFGVAGATGAADEVLCMNDTGGWHTLWVNPDTATNPIVAGTVDGGDIYVVLADGTIKVIRDRDNTTAPHLRYASGGGHTQQVADLYTGYLDFGLSNHWKMVGYLYLAVCNRAGEPYLGASNVLRVRYRYDTTGWGSYTSIDATTEFPALIPLPDAGQRGLPVRRIELNLRGEQAGVAEPFLVQEMSVYAERWVQPFWAYQFAIDLTEQSWPDGMYDGRSIHELRRKLAQLAGEEAGTAYSQYVQVPGAYTPPPHFPASWGGGRWKRTVAAAELMYGGTFGAGKGDGTFQVTVRDMSMPQALPPLASPH